MCSAIDRLLITWKSNLSDKIKGNFFQAAIVYTTARMHYMDANKTLREKA